MTRRALFATLAAALAGRKIAPATVSQAMPVATPPVPPDIVSALQAEWPLVVINRAEGSLWGFPDFNADCFNVLLRGGTFTDRTRLYLEKRIALLERDVGFFHPETRMARANRWLARQSED